MKTLVRDSLIAFLLLLLIPAGGAGDFATNANRLTYLTETDPFYVGLHFPRLETPQWIGEPGVEAVVTFGIDDMRNHVPYENFLRPILERLKKIDGRAPVSIFSNALNPAEPHLQSWLKEGVTMEVHTLAHPCPILAKSNFVAAAETFHGSVDLLHQIPGNKPVAFRTPCCDSINSASPRLFAELMCAKSPNDHFLSMDSSVVLLLTDRDPALPAAQLLDSAGRPRFLKYVPFPSFKTTIENYPYPFVINQLIWEMPFPAPSDWQSFHIQGKVSPQLLEDWKKALDLIVRKRGVLNFVLHPHGWSSAGQFVQFIDHAVQQHGRKVKFLNYREAHDLLVKNLLSGQPLRAPDGSDNGVRLLDLNNDGFLDVVIGNHSLRRTRLWDPETQRWQETDFPTLIVTEGQGSAKDAGARFAIIRPGGPVSLLVVNDETRGAWTFKDSRWQKDEPLLRGLPTDQNVLFARNGRDRGVRFRDLDVDGSCELLVANPDQNFIYKWIETRGAWQRLPFGLPGQARFVNAEAQDNGLRFQDLNEDGFDDLLLSNEHHYGVWTFNPSPQPESQSWWRLLSEGERADPGALPAFVRSGPHRNNGAWFHSGYLWVQNEETAHLPDLVERRSFPQLLEPFAKKWSSSLGAERIRE